jgi:hypothetical protein
MLRIIAEFLYITFAIHCTFELTIFTPVFLSPVVACDFIGKLFDQNDIILSDEYILSMTVLSVIVSLEVG